MGARKKGRHAVEESGHAECAATVQAKERAILLPPTGSGGATPQDGLSDNSLSLAVYGPGLLPNHAQLLADSAIAPDVAAARGYRSVEKQVELERMGFARAQRRVPALLIPIWGINGEIVLYQSRPDIPRVNRQGKPVKYETPSGARMALDAPPPTRGWLADPTHPLFITEGVRKADAAVSRGLACIALLGVWNWRGSNIQGGKTALPDWERVALNERQVFLCFDSDVMIKPQVHHSLARLMPFLQKRGAQVALIYLPPGDGAVKVGLDDYLAAGHDVGDLLTLASSELRLPVAEAEAGALSHTWPYKAKGGRLFYLSERISTDGSGNLEHRLVADFEARILEEARAEDGAVWFTMGGRTAQGRDFTLEISAADFAEERKLKAALLRAAGARAPIRAGQAKHLAPAIQLLTRDDLRQVRRYDRTGWAGSRFLLPGREEEGVTIHLPRKLPYGIARDADLDRGLAAFEALIQGNSPQRTTVPIAAVFEAPLARLAGWRGERYVVFVAGRTGSLKTSWCQTLMCLYGPDFMRDERLIKWGEGATRNAIMALAAHAHDLPLLIDNYKPATGGGGRDFVNLIHNILEGGEKDRLNRAAELREARPVFCWPLVTGEDVPTNDPASLARILIVPFEWPRGRDNPTLSQAQENAVHLSAVGAAWLSWLESEAGRESAKQARQQFPQLRAKWARFLLSTRADMVNILRVASNLASNQLTWSAMCQHPQIGSTAQRFSDMHKGGIRIVAETMAAYTAEALEAVRYLDALRELLNSGRAVLLPRGESLEGSGRYILLPKGDDSLERETVDRDQIIGWRDDRGSAYLLPTVARQAVERLIGTGNLGGLSDKALYAQLESLGAIASHDPGRQTKVLRLGKRTVRTLHLTAEALSWERELPE